VTIGAWMAAAGLEPRFASVEGVRVRYVRKGAGRPLLLVHGIASSLYTWKDLLGPLTAGHDVIALDLPGFGGSDQPSDLDALLYPRVLEAFTRFPGFARPSLVGHSLGGAVAVLFAAEHPRSVERLVLIDPAGFNLMPKDRPALLRAAAAAPAWLDRFPLPASVLRLGLKQVFHDAAVLTEERFAEYLAPLRRSGALASARSMMASVAITPAAFADEARRVKAPTLVLWGRHDRWIPLRDADRFTAAIPGARKLVIDGCGHLPQEEKPAETLACLREFLGNA
jgi:pimeloyl-ACP methyl ester carboxylesterase